MTARNSHVQSITDQIECAVAFGRSIDWMLTHLGVSLRLVLKTMSRMDALAVEVDRECPGAGLRKEAQQ